MTNREGRKRETHGRIVKAAGRKFREQGYVGAGIDSIMSEAGLTHGGFYAHFESKQALLLDTLIDAIEVQTRDLLFAGIEDKEGNAWLEAVLRRYLSRTHRDTVAEGCPLPTLISELPRAGAEVRRSFEQEINRLIAEIQDKLPAADALPPEDRFWAVLALCVGGMALARSVEDRALSDRILKACRHLGLSSMADAQME